MATTTLCDLLGITHGRDQMTIPGMLVSSNYKSFSHTSSRQVLSYVLRRPISIQSSAWNVGESSELQHHPELQTLLQLSSSQLWKVSYLSYVETLQLTCFSTTHVRLFQYSSALKWSLLRTQIILTRESTLRPLFGIERQPGLGCGT